MPIRFSCEFCRQKLSVSARKGGTTANCPNCKKEIRIPPAVDEVASSSLPAIQDGLAASVAFPLDPSSTTSSPPPLPFETAPPPIPSSTIASPPIDEDSYSQFVIYDDPSPAPQAAAGTAVSRGSATSSLRETLAIPRYLVYLQGGLLGAVGLVCFFLGILTGSTFFQTPPAAVASSVTVTGMVSFKSGNRVLPDEGAVVILLPDTKDPGERAAIAGLRPEDPLPAGQIAGLEQIRNMGGAYGRADAKGTYELKLPSRGKFFLLVLSKQASPTPKQEIKTEVMMRIGRFFENGQELVGNGRFQFTPEAIRADKRLNVVFD